MNNEIAEWDHWDENSIEVRGRDMFHIARELWPIPEEATEEEID